MPPLESVLATVGSMVFPDFDVCMWEERAESRQVRLFPSVFFQVIETRALDTTSLASRISAKQKKVTRLCGGTMFPASHRH